MDVRDLHRQALDAFTLRIDGIPAGAWRQPTPAGTGMSASW
jgi:hypothetical protein